MLAAAIRDRLRQVPFAPFIIQMNDGRTFPIHHPDFADVSPKGSTVTVYGEDDGSLLLSSILIASLEPLTRVPAQKKKRRR